MRNIKVIGIDLAKNVFQIHGTDAKGKCVLKKRLARAKLIEFVAQLPPCIIGIEACTGAHYWGRLFNQMGHTTKMMAPHFVKPYIRSNKNDRNDARGIAEAVTRPDMKFVPIKTVSQQDTLLLHRARNLLIKQRTALSNQIRGLLAEYGVVIPKGISHVKKLVEILDTDSLTIKAKSVFKKLYEQFNRFNTEIAEYEKENEAFVKQDAVCQEIMKIEGVGPLTASAVIATIGDPKAFKNGREVAAWLGLVPKQHSSGNTIRLSGISKRGDRYVRTLLVHGARSVVNNCEKKSDKKNIWVKDKKIRKGHNKACVALANKHARVIWAILSTGECYRASC